MSLFPAGPVLLALAVTPLFAESVTVLENAHIRVIHAIDRPHQKTALHKHDFNRVMIYITGGELDVSTEDGRVTRQQWKAGDVAWSPTGPMHVSENVGTADLEIIEVEIRKAGPEGPVKRNPSLDPIAIDPKRNKLLYENAQVRVFRCALEMDGREQWHEHMGAGRLTVLLTPLSARLEQAKKQSAPMTGGPGDVFWSEGSVRHRSSNLGVRPAEVVVVEVK
jgi:quercetin dioxygenase-like cupin family protein